MAYNFDLGVADGNPQLAPLADAATLYPKIAQLHLKYMRLMCPWNFVAKAQTPGSFVAGTPPTTTGRDWTYVDRCINDIFLRSGADVLMIIGQGRPSWGGWWFGFGATIGNATDYGNFVTEVVNRYKPGGVGIRTDGIYAPNAGKGVTHWEIWNEQNSPLWGANVNPTEYTAYLKNAYNAIKAIQPGTASTVLFGGMQHVERIPGGYLGYGSNNLDELTFLTRCYAAGAHGYFDAMATHIYTQSDTEAPPVALPGTTPGPEPATTTDNWQQVLAIRALMVTKGDSAKPIWITECGFATQSLSEALQSSYMQQLFNNLNTLSYISTVIMYNARDNSTDTSNWENTFGFLRYNWAPKALWSFLLSIAPNLAAGTVTIPLSLSGSGVRGGIAGATVSLTLSITGTGVERTSGAGTISIPLAVTGTGVRPSGSGTITLTLTVSGTGLEREAGSGTVTLPLAVSGTGIEREAATGTVTLPLAISGTAGALAEGTVSLTLSITGTGTDREAGAGTVTLTIALSGTALAYMPRRPSRNTNQAINRSAVV